MPKRSSTHQGPGDVNEIAFRVFQESVGEAPQSTEKVKNQAAVELGRMGGRVGGAAMAASLTPEKRSEIAKKAAAARWSAKHTD